MNCPDCQTPNPTQARFCLACGRLLASGWVCTACHTLLPAHARYCFHCGAVVVPPPFVCTGCGASVALGQTHCSRCGAEVPQPAGPQPTPPPSAAPPAPPPTAAPDIAEAVSVKVAGRTQRMTHALGLLPPPHPLQEMLPALQRYLPYHLFEPLERDPAERDLLRAQDHLSALLETVKTYLPRPVVMAPQPAGEPSGRLYRGTFLFVDVSGFTPLSERLSLLGQAGAERITEIINEVFSDTASILYGHGGTLLKFGGDALLGLFANGHGDSDEAMAEGALRAVQAASAMQAAMHKFAAIDAGGEPHALRIKCGISSGRYFAAHIGTRHSMAYVTIGHTVNHADQAEGHAAPGDVVITQSTCDLLGGQANVELRAEGFYLVREVPAAMGSVGFSPLKEPPEGDVQAQITYLVERMDRLSPYLPTDLLPRIVNNPHSVLITPDRRPVTVMFANYVGASDLIQDMGDSYPQLIAHHLNDYFVHMARIVERYDGAVGRMDHYSEGDRLIVFFGAPRAHEDDPRRAVATALEMQEATHRHFAALQTPEAIYRFHQRIGINTGYLFAGNVGAPNLRQEYTLMGDDINTAARLMSAARWASAANPDRGEILISSKTEERVKAFFKLEDRGEIQVKGKELHIHTFQVLGEREEIGRTRGLGDRESPLVDRDDELLALQECGHKLLAGRGQILSVVGDSGLGKSRLMRELRGWLVGKEGAGDVAWLEGYALSFSERVSYWLVVQMVRSALGLKADASADDALFVLWKRCESLLGKETARDAFPFLAHLMDLPLEGQWAQRVEGLDPQVRQKQTFWAAREFFKAMGRQQHTVIALDDLHWADEASLALVENLLSVTDHAPLLFCLIFRQRQDKGCWRLRDKAASTYPHRYAEVTLEPLTEAYSRQLLEELVPGATFSPQTLEDILAKAAGNPFYLEEVIRSLQDDGAIVRDQDHRGRWRITARITDISVPDSLQSAILARIDRLTEDARQALQMAAVIGRRFEMQVLWGLIQAEAELQSWLAQLERNALIRTAQLEPEPVYAFPDALVHEVAYDSLLVQRRQEFHRRVGETLETIYAERLEQACEFLAYHFGRSDDHERAAKYLEMAGHKAQAEFANETAVRHYTELLALLGDGEKTWEKRFDVLARRQQVHGLTGRQEERQSDLDVMLKLAHEHADELRRSDTLNELADLYQWTGRYDEAEQAARQALELKTGLRDQGGQAAALDQLGVLSYYRGDYGPARSSLGQAVSLWRQVNDPKGEAWSLMYLGMIHFLEGNYSEAAQYHDSALQMAQARQDWYQEGIHLTNSARVALRLGEYEQALAQFERSLEMKRRVGDRTGQGFSWSFIGLTLTYLGRYDEAESAFQDSLELRRRIDDERGIGYSLYGLGLAVLGRGHFGQAEHYFRQAYEIHSRLGLKAETIVDLSYLGQARLGLDKLDEALEASDRAMVLLAEQRNVEEVQQVYFNHFRVLAAREDPSAREVLRSAQEAMATQAERIAAQEKRQAFLNQVKVNREIKAALQLRT
jgi:class 3 adenylate cyclase/tetratricopeptide (TPR) repeat protein